MDYRKRKINSFENELNSKKRKINSSFTIAYGKRKRKRNEEDELLLKIIKKHKNICCYEEYRKLKREINIYT